jgi:diaminopimelate dehydrogenase
MIIKSKAGNGNKIHIYIDDEYALTVYDDYWHQNGFKDGEVITEEELATNHAGIPHGGFVIRSGKTGWNEEHNHIIEYSLKLDSNPEFTASVIVAYARAAYCMSKEGQAGCKTVFDVAPAYLSPVSAEELRAKLL